jgi:spore maturation protein CgeB
VNPRTFEIAACGAFQLVDYRSELPDVFTPGEEIVCFRDLEELRNQIGYYLEHPDERRRIAEKARSRVLKEHTYQARMETMLSFIRARLPEAFAHKAAPGSVTLDLADFCRRFPETQSLLAQAGSSGPMDLDGIVDAIQADRGTLKKHEAVFLLMKEFREKISGMRN